MMIQQRPPAEATYEEPKNATTAGVENEEDDEDEYDNEDVDDDNFNHNKIPMFIAKADFIAKEPGDLSFKKNDRFKPIATRQDGWWVVENEKKEQGLVPSTYLKMLTQYEDMPSPSPARSRPTIGVAQAVWQENDVSDVLQSMGALPLGCTPSVLYKLIRANPRLSLEFHLLPKLSQTGIGFHDLYWNVERDKLRKRHVRVLKLFKVLRCENMPVETIDIDVVHRYVRFCLFDGSKVLSNIHSIKAQFNKKRSKTWTFLGRLEQNNSCAELGSFFVRSNFANNDVKLLVEVGMAYIRTTTKEYGEISVGWSTIPLLTDAGQMRLEDDKLYAVSLKGGSPFDKEIQPHITSKPQNQQNAGFLQTVLAGERVAKVVVRVTAPTQEILEQLDSGPDTLVWNTMFVPFMFWYRHLAGEHILRQRTKDQEGSAVLASITTLVPDSFLASFPKAVVSNQIMDVLRVQWEERLKLIPKTDKKSTEKLALAFRELFMDIGLPLLQTPGLQRLDFNPALAEKITQDFKDFLQQYRIDKTSSSWLANKPAAPLNLAHMMVDLSNVYAE